MKLTLESKDPAYLDSAQEMLLEQLYLQVRVVHLRELIAIERILIERGAMGGVVKPVREAFQIAGIQPGVFEAAPDRVNRSRLAAYLRGVMTDRDETRERQMFALAGLAGLGRINNNAVNALNRRYGFGIGRQSSWTRMIDSAAGRGQSGTVLVMTGTGLQTPSWSDVPGAHLYHSVAALKRTGQDYTARMIAAEALSRT